jgi:DNA adenine methylase
MPAHTCYVEPFAGSLAVMLHKSPQGISEVANDLDGTLSNFWKVLQDEDSFTRFVRRVETIPFSETEWHYAREALKTDPDADAIDRAVWFFVQARQSVGSRGRQFKPPTRTRRRGMSQNLSAWLSAIDGLPAVHARLRRVQILCRPALKVIRDIDGPDTLIYAEPPYLPSTRKEAKVYREEMTDADHRELLDTLLACKSKVMLSGYANPLYDTMLSSWQRHDFRLRKRSAHGKHMALQATECLWCNF